MASFVTFGLAAGSGGLVGVVLGLVGGGGSILAVPLLTYAVGVNSPHVAIGTSALAVSVSAAGNLVPQWRAGNVKWRCAGAFSLAGVLGALAGSAAARAVDGQSLLALFGFVMLAVGGLMLRRRRGEGDPDVRLTKASAPVLVPGLMLATSMPLPMAIGTSLVAVSAFGAATAASYAVSGLIDWTLAGLFILGGALGGLVGSRLGQRLAGHKRALTITFAGLMILVGLYVVARGLPALLGRA